MASFAFSSVGRPSGALHNQRHSPVVRSAPRAVSSVSEERRGEEAAVKPLRFLAASAAAFVLVATPVEAGVILEQPQLKRLDLGPTPAGAPAPKSTPKRVAESSMGGGFGFLFDIGFLSLPLTAAGCVGLYVAGSRSGTDFESFMNKAWLKDSTVNGIGYEEIYKSTDYSKGRR